jgi:hypothetical protein
MWSGNGNYYDATIVSIDSDAQIVLVDWDDHDWDVFEGKWCAQPKPWQGGSWTIKECADECHNFRYFLHATEGNSDCACMNECTQRLNTWGVFLYLPTELYVHREVQFSQARDISDTGCMAGELNHLGQPFQLGNTHIPALPCTIANVVDYISILVGPYAIMLLLTI